MTKSRFVHLHIHSEYSMIDGLAKVNELIQRATLFKMSSIALTDFNNLFGCIKFYDAAYRQNIKPIIGADFLIQTDTLIDKTPSTLTCLVMNTQGYHHLITLISKAYKNKSNNSTIVPMIQYRWLIEYNEGLILLSGGQYGDIGKFLLKNNKPKIEKYLSFYNKYFPNRYYIELTRTNRKNEEHYLQLAIDLSVIKGLPVVATNDVRFINKQDFQAHKIRVAIHNGTIVNDNNKDLCTKYSVQQFMKSEQEMCDLFSDIPESLINSVEIAYRCNLIINLGHSFLPKFPTGAISTDKFLNIQSIQGLEKRLTLLFPKESEKNMKRAPYDSRLKHELQIINRMGLAGYFLIVMEFIQWAKKNNIPVGPGRGSGASSLVAYALKITEIDPLQFDLLFERFLNPERISMPDLDIDFCMEHRDLVIDHVVNTYGKNSVSQIITFGTMAAKAAIRDVGRALGHSYTFVNRIAKLIPIESGITLKKALDIEPQLQSLYKNNEEIKILINMAQQLEGIVKNVSKHAGGVVISPTKITDFTPLYYDCDSMHSITQFDKDDIERIGLIKFDFLGLRTLTVINQTIKMINQQKNPRDFTNINLYTISLNDSKSFHTLCTAETTGIFQLESYGIKKLIQRLKPDCFEDLIALVALFRPGPLQSGMVDNFINRKHGYEPISYPDIKWQHESLRPVLESTYGIILYQEQVMQIAQVLAKYTLGKADILRRAIGKKKPEDMIKQRSIFHSGATHNGINTVLSMKIFDLVEKFAGYGFNKSHSVAYALISYQTLWLKTHYPAEFMAATLSSEIDNLNKIIHLINECKRMKIHILPPDINNSQYHFYVNKNKEIVYGIGAIKGIGKTSIESIIAARDKDGNFTGLFDFCMRLNATNINHRVIEKLIFSGSCDTFGICRSELITSLSDILKYITQYKQQKNIKQLDMFNKTYLDHYTNTKSYNITTVPQWSYRLLLEKEKEVLGFYLTNHPTIQYIKDIQPYIPDLITIKNIFLKKNREQINTIGIIISIRTKLSKQGNYIMFCTLEDHTEKIEILIFSKLIHKYQYYLKENNTLFIQGIINIDKINRSYKIIVQKLQDIDDIIKKHACKLSIILTNEQINDHTLNNIYNLLEKNKSDNLPVYFFYYKNGIKIGLRCKKKWCITLTDQLLINLRNLIGYNQVTLDLHQ